MCVKLNLRWCDNLWSKIINWINRCVGLRERWTPDVGNKGSFLVNGQKSDPGSQFQSKQEDFSKRCMRLDAQLKLTAVSLLYFDLKGIFWVKFDTTVRFYIHGFLLVVNIVRTYTLPRYAPTRSSTWPWALGARSNLTSSLDRHIGFPNGGKYIWNAFLAQISCNKSS